MDIFSRTTTSVDDRSVASITAPYTYSYAAVRATYANANTISYPARESCRAKLAVALSTFPVAGPALPFAIPFPLSLRALSLPRPFSHTQTSFALPPTSQPRADRRRTHGA